MGSMSKDMKHFISSGAIIATMCMGISLAIMGGYLTPFTAAPFEWAMLPAGYVFGVSAGKLYRTYKKTGVMQ